MSFGRYYVDIDYPVDGDVIDGRKMDILMF